MARQPRVKAHPLFHEFIKYWRVHGPPPGCSIVVAVSGGLDSVVLLDLLARSQQVLQLNLGIGHVHHGQYGSRQQIAFRKKAQTLVASVAKSYHLPLQSQELTAARSQSEASMREHRYKALNQFKKKFSRNGACLLATAHHQDDLFETRLIRLIRGTGPQGLKGMEYFDGSLVRPLIYFPHSLLVEYAVQMQLKWCEDPSNSSNEPLRNWLRNFWLPALETQFPGSQKNFARSLQVIAESLEGSMGSLPQAVTKMGIDRQKFLVLRREDQRLALAQYLRNQNVQSYSMAHIEEILKRLDNQQKEIRFTLLKLQWTAGPDWIKAK